MRIRDIDRPGLYGRHAAGTLRPEADGEGLPVTSGLKIVTTHVAGFWIVPCVPLGRLLSVPVVESADGLQPMSAELLFSAEDDWQFLFDGSEPDMSTGAPMSAMLRLCGASDQQARSMTRAKLADHYGALAARDGDVDAPRRPAPEAAR